MFRSRFARRVLGGIAAITVATAGLAIVEPDVASAAENTLSFFPGDPHRTFGPNATIMIDGTLEYDGSCAEVQGSRDGQPDFIYPATDVYIVPSGYSGGALEDIGGDGPNTIVGQASHVFIDEIIGFTSPGGKVPEGTYSVVYDTCQDGVYDPSNDEIFDDVITVEMPEGDLPPVSGSIAALKEKERVQYQSWVETHTVMTALFKADKAVIFASCLIAPNPACLAEFLLALYDIDSVSSAVNNPVEERVLGLIMNVAKSHGAIWKDPPDANFEQPATIDDVPYDDLPATGNELADAISNLLPTLAAEAELSNALLHAVERYQGAQAAGDAAWTLAHAREVRDIAATLADQMNATDAVEDFNALYAADEQHLEDRYNEGRHLLRRLQSTGLNPQERANLLNQGYDNDEIEQLERAVVNMKGLPQFLEGSINQPFEKVVAARAGMLDALDETVTGWSELVAELEARTPAAKQHPIADAAGPYTVAAGANITLDGSGSSAPAGTIATYAWDLDGDGAFDDATGATPSAAFEQNTTIGLKVTDSKGRVATDFASVAVTNADNPPVITAQNPAAAVTMTAGTANSFSVTANDPDGEALSYLWLLDGDVVGTDATFTYTPGANDTGVHTVRVKVTGGDGPGTAQRAWYLSVRAVDADGDGWTAAVDCNDNRADIRPGSLERFGNEIDDDCDPATADGPLGGLTGTLYSWGYDSAVGKPGLFGTQYSPVHLNELGEVRHMDNAHTVGLAVMADGTVRSWGSNWQGSLGTGLPAASRTPVQVVGVGGTGVLGGVTEISADDEHVVARRNDGSVVAWGRGDNGQNGDGSNTLGRLYPVQVTNPDGTPLMGAAHVETGETSQWALMEDGTVRTWGVNHCDSSLDITRNNRATPHPGWGTNNVQLESGDHGWTIVRKADGSVWACGGDWYLLNRPAAGRTGSELYTPRQMLAFGPGSGIVDVTAGSSHGAALKDDGTVYIWGRNVNHPLDVIGKPANHTQETPTAVPLPPGPPVIDIESDYTSQIFATRADGSVIVFGSNTNGAAGIGSTSSYVQGFGQPTIPARVVTVTTSSWNSLALVRPLDDPQWERPVQWINASVADIEIGEADGGAFTVTLSAPAPEALDVTYTFGEGDDATEGTATIAKGATSVDIPVSVDDDNVDEDDEFVAFQYDVSNGVKVDDPTAVATVIDDDAAPTISVASATVMEGHTSLTDAVLTVTLSAPSTRTVSVDYTTADGSAEAPGDYTEAHGTVEFFAGETETQIHVPVAGDNEMEVTEQLSVELSNPVNGSLGESTAAVTIVDDEPVLVEVTSPEVDEGDTGTTTATFEVEASAFPAGQTVTIPWTLKAGTAEFDTDVVNASGTLVFEHADTLTVNVDVVTDEIEEDLETETFKLVLGDAVASDGRPVVVGDAAAATIVDDDAVDTTPEVDAGDDVTGAEGSAIAIAGTATVGELTTEWTVDKPQCTIADPSALETTVTCTDNMVATLTLTADDGDEAVSDTATLVATNAMPTATIVKPVAGTVAALDKPVQFQANVTDAGASDITSCSVNWGDGTPLTGKCVDTHTYTKVGTFNIVTVVTDDDGGVGLAIRSITVDRGCTITGTEGADVIVGTSGNDVICGLGGWDVLYGGGGNDVVYGDAGLDFVFGDAGNDTLYGGADVDILYGHKGDDRLDGGTGLTLKDTTLNVMWCGAGRDVNRNGIASSDCEAIWE